MAGIFESIHEGTLNTSLPLVGPMRSPCYLLLKAIGPRAARMEQSECSCKAAGGAHQFSALTEAIVSIQCKLQSLGHR